MNRHTVIVDGQTIDAGSEQAVKTITGLQTQIANDNRTAADRQAVIAVKDREIGEKTAQADHLRNQVADQDKLTLALGELKALCEDRLKLDVTGRTLTDMKRDALTQKLGAGSLEGKDAAYVDARFDLVLDSVAMGSADPFRDALRDGRPAVNSPEAAYSHMSDEMQTAWKH